MKDLKLFKENGISLTQIEELLRNPNFDIFFGEILDLQNPIYTKYFCLTLRLNLQDDSIIEKFVYNPKSNLFIYKEEISNLNVMDNKKYKCFTDFMNRFYETLNRVLQVAIGEEQLNLDSIKSIEKQIEVLEQGSIDTNIGETISETYYGKYLTYKYMICMDYINKKYFIEYYGTLDLYDNIVPPYEYKELTENSLNDLRYKFENKFNIKELHIEYISDLKKTKELFLNLYSEFLV